MARKSRKSIPETVSSAAVQEEIKRPFRAGLYARISMETEETIERVFQWVLNEAGTDEKLCG